MRRALRSGATAAGIALPGGGRTDNTDYAWEAGGDCWVSVWANNYGFYCQKYRPGTWYR